VALLSVAAKLWNDSILGIDAQAGLLKLESMGVVRNNEENFAFSYRYENPSSNLVTLESAIFDEKIVEFLYRDGSTKRHIEPYKIYLWRGFWYLFGKDIDKTEMRSFKISRISGEVSITNKKFKTPDTVQIEKFLPVQETFEVLIEIPEGKSAVLRNLGNVSHSQNGYQTCKILFSDADSALREILRHGQDVRIVEPIELKNAIRNHLEVLANV
jgi:proteasome accessory factor B